MTDNFIPGVVIGTILTLMFMLIVVSGVNDSWREQIAKHGCAHYYLDADDNRQWDWIKP